MTPQAIVPRRIITHAIAPSAADLPPDLLPKLANHIPTRPVLAHEIPPPRAAQAPPAAHHGGVLPHQLREVARLLAEPRIAVVILLPLISPQVHAPRHLAAAQRQVLAVRAAGVGEVAL